MTSKSQVTQKTFKIEGMHCVACSLNIDGELEDTNGIVESDTNYAKAETTVTFDPDHVDAKTIAAVIEGLGYSVSDII